MLPYIARPHPFADKFVRSHFGDSFGQLPFVHRDPLANQFDGSFLIGFIRTIPGFPLESKVVTRTFQPAAICVADLFNLAHYLLTAGSAKSRPDQAGSRGVRAPNSLAAQQSSSRS